MFLYVNHWQNLRSEPESLRFADSHTESATAPPVNPAMVSVLVEMS